jgi:hypothetical protein
MGDFIYFSSVFPIMFPSMWLRKKNKKIKTIGEPHELMNRKNNREYC